MRELLDTIFRDCGFGTEESSDVRFYRKLSDDKIEYYLVYFISGNDFKNFNEESLSIVHSLFDEKGKFIKDVVKNTSLIITVEFTDFEKDCLRFKNQMLKIEEDDYWFKKYLLPFTLSAIEKIEIDDHQRISHQLNNIVSNKLLFEKFANNIYGNDLYFFVVQLFLKLPFLNLYSDPQQQFTSIKQLLQKKISSSEMDFYENILLRYPINSESKEHLIKTILDPKDNSFDSFLKNFIDDASNK